MFRVIFDGKRYRAQCVGDETNSFDCDDWRVFAAELKARLDNERALFEVHAGQISGQEKDKGATILYESDVQRLTRQIADGRLPLFKNRRKHNDD